LAGEEDRNDIGLYHPTFRAKAASALEEFDEAFRGLGGSGTRAERERLKRATDDLMRILVGTMVHLE
jgi:hypothetical protein